MTGNSKYNKRFEVEKLSSAATEAPSSVPMEASDLEPTALDLEPMEASGPTAASTSEPAEASSSGPADASPSGPKIDESSVMVSGMVPMMIDFEGNPIWISKDLNSKRAFRPQKIKFEVSNLSALQKFK